MEMKPHIMFLYEFPLLLSEFEGVRTINNNGLGLAQFLIPLDHAL